MTHRSLLAALLVASVAVSAARNVWLERVSESESESDAVVFVAATSSPSSSSPSPSSSSPSSSSPSSLSPSSSSPSAKPTASPTVQKRLAICVTGQLRSFRMRRGEPGWPVGTWQPMITPLPEFDETPPELFRRNVAPAGDVFVYVTTGGNPAREPTTPEEIAETCAAFNATACRIGPETEVQKPGSPELWANFAYAEDRLQRSFVRQVRDMAECMAMVDSSGVAYTHIARVRPDFIFLDALPPLAALESRKMYTVAREVCCCGNEDIFGIGDAETMRPVMRRYFGLESAAFSGEWVAETFVNYTLARLNATIEYLSSVRGCIVKPSWRVAAGEP